MDPSNANNPSNPTPPELDYQQIFRELNEAQIDYLVIGGLAVNLHGIPRMTYDIDFMILLEDGNIRKLVRKLGKWGYRPRVPVNPEDLADGKNREGWIRDKNMKAFSFYNDTQPISEIDILIDSPSPYKEMRDRAILFKVGDVEVPVVSIPDLIVLKAGSGRKQDISDVEHLRSLLEG
jgi:predicted nucleotidyltransferase